MEDGRREPSEKRRRGPRPAARRDRGAFGVWLVAAREAAGLTQEEAARIAGISRITLARYETGAAVPHRRIPELARAVLKSEGEAFERAGRLAPAGESSDAEAAAGDRLRVARVAAGLALEDFASRCGVGPQAVAAYEAGRAAMPARVVQAACRVLAIRADWLFGLEGEAEGR